MSESTQAPDEPEPSVSDIRETMQEAIATADAAVVVTIPDLSSDPTDTRLSSFVADEFEDMVPNPYKILWERGTAHIARFGGDASKYGVAMALGGSFHSEQGYRAVDTDLDREDDG